MCGINFILDLSQNNHTSSIQKMNGALQHRGPDHTGYHQRQNNIASYHLGATRLKIVDENDQSNQPILSADNKYGLIFNGEIYNYIELKKLLSKDYTFQTESDTEVLLAHLIIKGENGISELDGMFSFIFIDFEQNRVIATRDPSGIKPLYYYQKGSCIIFSSEIKGILASGLVEQTLNQNQIEHYIQYRYANRPETFFKNIYEIEPSCFAIIDCGQIKFHRYQITHSEKTLDSLESLLIKTLKDQTQLNIPIGLLFSGGIDSTVLLTLLKNSGHDNLICFTIGNTESGTKDIKFAKDIANHFRIKHEVIDLIPSDLDAFEEYIRKLDQPIADGAGFLTWLITKKASSKVKVLYSGAGADELFAGYNRHQAFHKYLSLFWKNPIARTSVKLFSKLRNDNNKKNRLLKIFAKSISADPFSTYDNFRSLRTQKLVQANCSLKFETNSKKDLFKFALETDRLDYLVNDVLKITDNMSMQNSVEVRVPFLSNNIINFAQNLSYNDLVKKEPKWMLIEILKKQLPEHLFRRKKEGFGMPFGKWLMEDKLGHIISILNNDKSLIFNHMDFNEVQSIVKLHKSGKDDFTNELWALCTLAHWLNNNFAI